MHQQGSALLQLQTWVCIRLRAAATQQPGPLKHAGQAGAGVPRGSSSLPVPLQRNKSEEGEAMLAHRRRAVTGHCCKAQTHDCDCPQPAGQQAPLGLSGAAAHGVLARRNTHLPAAGLHS